MPASAVIAAAYRRPPRTLGDSARTAPVSFAPCVRMELELTRFALGTCRSRAQAVSVHAVLVSKLVLVLPVALPAKGDTSLPTWHAP